MTYATMTFHEAAEFLGVSDVYLHQLVGRGVLLVSRAGEQCYIRVADIIIYDRLRQDIQRRAIDEIARISQDCGAYN